MAADKPIIFISAMDDAICPWHFGKQNGFTDKPLLKWSL